MKPTTHRKDAETQRNGSNRGVAIPSAATNLLLRVGAILFATLKEIFDESAYARFLARNRLASSGDAYLAFLQEKSGGTPRPKCC